MFSIHQPSGDGYTLLYYYVYWNECNVLRGSKGAGETDAGEYKTIYIFCSFRKYGLVLDCVRNFLIFRLCNTEMWGIIYEFEESKNTFENESLKIEQF